MKAAHGAALSACVKTKNAVCAAPIAIFLSEYNVISYGAPSPDSQYKPPSSGESAACATSGGWWPHRPPRTGVQNPATNSLSSVPGSSGTAGVSTQDVPGSIA